MKTFKREDNWNEDILFSYSKGNLIAAEKLICTKDYNEYVAVIYSAGYLIHIGIELFLKACVLFEKHEFLSNHDVVNLFREISFLENESNYERHLTNIQQFYGLRYPENLTFEKINPQDIDANYNLEIGDNNWVEALELIEFIRCKMPEELKIICDKHYHIFDNSLNEDKYLKDGYLYRLVIDI